jgi:hypothetical protein
MIYATERAAAQVAEQLNHNLAESERQQGSYIVRIRVEGGPNLGHSAAAKCRLRAPMVL